MSFSNEQILNSLISFYARKGVDMSYVLGDPIFRKLPVEDQVEAVRKNADRILAGTSPNLLRGEKRLIWQGALGNSLAAGLTAGGLAGTVLHNTKLIDKVSRNKALALAAGTAVGIGAVTGYATGRLQTDDSLRGRLAVHKELQNLAANPTNENALGAIASSHIYSQTSAPRRDLMNRVIGVINSLSSGADAHKRMEDDFKSHYSSYNGYQWPKE